MKTYAFTAHFIGPGVISSTHRPFLAWARLTYLVTPPLVDLPELGMLLESRVRGGEIEVAARPLDA